MCSVSATAKESCLVVPSESVPDRDETKHHMPDPHEIILDTISIFLRSDFAMFGNLIIPCHPPISIW